MSRQIQLNTELVQYIGDHLQREPDYLRELRAETAQMRTAGMQIAPEQARFMTVVLRAMQARRALEVGVFTGYSALVTALALPADGTVVACDVSEEWTSIARRYWDRAGVAERIDLRLAPASETLGRLLEAGESGRYDFAFIDADKSNYDDYYEKCLALLRVGGLLMIDNSLWGGAVVDAGKADADTRAIRDLNAKIAKDDRVDAYLAPIGDGIHMACKR